LGRAEQGGSLLLLMVIALEKKSGGPSRKGKEKGKNFVFAKGEAGIFSQGREKEDNPEEGKLSLI